MDSKISRPALSLPIMRSRGDWFVAAVWCLIVMAGVCRATEAAAIADTKDAEKPPGELSVAPLAFPAYPADRPDWVDQTPRLDGVVHQWPVVSVPSLDRERCRESLRQQTRIAISAYASHLFEHDHLSALDSSDGESSAYPSHLIDLDHHGRTRAPITVKEAWVRAFLDDAERSYFGTVGTSEGEMFEEAALLHFDDAFRETLQKEWQSQRVGRRLTGLGLLGGGSMVLLVALSSVLRWAGSRKPASRFA